ncbi:TonB-dependent receptor [Novosphingobium umbonatum]|uniref:TonB-dependent receptor n=1 Tax=Novosphingobium umbonatum TaxID=1908524 RepID=A0A3S3TPV8_9SPHN|nr:TonB-dependent receptor [Novosphingobium umbonatum]RVU05875.1 TonB-dependent receptor [Novosphingobium umbonatum]
MTNRTSRLAPAITLLLCGTAMPALAQSANPPSAGLSDIIVTAERREQSLQQVPISATVLTGEDLQRKGVGNLADIQQVAPSVAINTVNRSTFINIRGVGIAQSAPTSNPGVAYYIDGQLIPHEQFIGMSFYDIGSIEVLRGPQGTLTGQNSTGGAIFVRSPKAKFDDFSGSINLLGSNYAHARGEVAANIGGKNVALRLAYVHEERDSFTRNIASNAQGQPGNMKLDALRANLRLQAIDGQLNVDLRGEYFDMRSNGIAIKNRNDAVTKDPFVIEEDARSYMNQHGYRLAADMRMDITQGVQVRSLTSWQDGFTRDQVDGDRTATAAPRPPAANVGRVSQSSTQFQTFIQEFNLLSTSKGPTQWVLGAFFMDEKVPVTLLRDNNHVTDFVSSTSSIITTAKNTTYSAFGQINHHFGEHWEVVAGGRYSSDGQIYTRIAVPGSGFTLPFTSSISTKQFTGKLGVNYHFGREGMVYATASKGYKAGGVNLTPNTPNFTPERNVVYELGFKSQLFDRHLRVNGDVFYSDYKDIQLSSLVNGLPTTQNALAGHSKGAELEVTGQFGALGFNLGGGILDAQFANAACISDTNAAGTDAGCLTNLRLVPKGRVLPFSPKLTLNAGVQYALSIGSVQVTPRLQWSHLSSQNATPFPSANTLVPERDVVDARVTVDFGKAYQVEAFAQNLTNKIYIASQIQNSSSADGGIIYGAPRTWGIRFKAAFGR